uniref:Uncharacterized protein n=1 Tax=Chromera velia CCMP2878 TaxID=1169474 RepID=A0A0G4F3Y7_9ALVE|eukprot:Cvel_14962.t1-p1 / transcript=Cvel_14962.t1 / gene=Cvel_14962 / organism=Chromera_velia_CCMP2878 / gene_product=hypothetical protein / transcript_product=hypothetical protein / location=Cvel_scaffold1086:26984-28888(+) / protein_length=635 / sequence_SO=supercontig / SO=protein_coding / is_pseudo=false
MKFVLSSSTFPLFFAGDLFVILVVEPLTIPRLRASLQHPRVSHDTFLAIAKYCIELVRNGQGGTVTLRGCTPFRKSWWPLQNREVAATSEPVAHQQLAVTTGNLRESARPGMSVVHGDFIEETGLFVKPIFISKHRGAMQFNLLEASPGESKGGGRSRGSRHGAAEDPAVFGKATVVVVSEERKQISLFFLDTAREWSVVLMDGRACHSRLGIADSTSQAGELAEEIKKAYENTNPWSEEHFLGSLFELLTPIFLHSHTALYVAIAYLFLTGIMVFWEDGWVYVSIGLYAFVCPYFVREVTPTDRKTLRKCLAGIKELVEIGWGAMMVFPMRDPEDAFILQIQKKEKVECGHQFLSSFDPSEPSHDGAVLIEGDCISYRRAMICVENRKPLWCKKRQPPLEVKSFRVQAAETLSREGAPVVLALHGDARELFVFFEEAGVQRVIRMDPRVTEELARVERRLRAVLCRGDMTWWKWCKNSISDGYATGIFGMAVKAFLCLLFLFLCVRFMYAALLMFVEMVYVIFSIFLFDWTSSWVMLIWFSSALLLLVFFFLQEFFVTYRARRREEKVDRAEEEEEGRGNGRRGGRLAGLIEILVASWIAAYQRLLGAEEFRRQGIRERDQRPAHEGNEHSEGI